MEPVYLDESRTDEERVRLSVTDDAGGKGFPAPLRCPGGGARLGIPSYNWWNEALHGVARAGAATVFPQAIGLAAMFDEALLEKIGDVTALEGRAKYHEAVRNGDRGLYKGNYLLVSQYQHFPRSEMGTGT